MRDQNPPAVQRFIKIAGSNGFWRFILALLVLQAVWIALSGRYPMAFDEDFHLGIIRLYAHHISPFWSRNPAGSDALGVVSRDPSYLFQYLMSFPYRLVSLFTANQTVQVLFLRAICIGLFVGGVVLYRRLLLKTGASRALVQVCLLVFVLIPIVPLLAAQINYDNLLLPLSALALLLTLSFDDSLASKKRLDLKLLGQLLIVCLLTSLVKYTFLPVFLVIVGFVVARLWQYRLKLPKPYFGLAASWRRLGGWAQLGLVAGLVLSSGLYMQRYGVNLVRYRTPVPACDQVLSIRQCSAYGPWERDYNDMQDKIDGDQVTSPLIFTADWFYGMWLRSFFAVAGPSIGYQTRGPLLVPGLASIAFAGLAVAAVMIAAVKKSRRYKERELWLFAAVSAVYVAALWLDEYQAFLKTGQPVAINGRYLLPVLPLALVINGLAITAILRHRQIAKVTLAGIVVLSLLWGGGAMTYVLRSNDSWYWPGSGLVRGVNRDLQRVLGPVTPGYNRPTEFMGRHGT